MPNPAWVTPENVKFNGTLDNAAVLKNSGGIKTVVLWDSLSVEDQTILINAVNNNGGTVPLAGPTPGHQTLNFNGAVVGANPTGLNNTASALAGIATINLGGSAVGGNPSGFSVTGNTAGKQSVHFENGTVSATPTGFVTPTSGYQVADFTVAKAGGDSTGLTNDVPATSGYQVVDVGGAQVGGNASGLAADVPATAGYQVIDVGGTRVGADITGLTNDATVYTATITVDGVAKPIAVTGSAAQDYTTLLAEINTDLGASAVAALDAGNIKVTSATTGVTSTVATVDVDLFSTLATYVAINAAVGGVNTMVTTYTATITVDGVAKPISVAGGVAQTYTTLLSEINTDLGASAVAALVGGDIKVTSATTGVTSTVATVDTDLFSSLTGYVAVNAAVGGVNTIVTTYTATITVDGVAKPISIGGGAAQTFTTLLSEINTDLGASAVAALVGGDIKVTSATTSTTSTVAITAGTLFPALTSFGSLQVSVPGVGSLVALTATIKLDAAAPTPISILPGAMLTFGAVVTELQTAIGGAGVVALVGTDIVVTSATTGSASKVVITAGTLFPALAGFMLIHPAQNGVAESKTYSAVVVVDGTIVKSLNTNGVEGDTFTDFITAINTDLAGSAVAALSGGNVVITSATTGVASSVRVADTGFMFNTLTGYAGISFADGVAPRTYTATITVDGVTKPISIVGNAAQTVTTLVSQINTDLGASAVAAITGGNIVVTSASTGILSTVETVDNGLFDSVTGYVGEIVSVPGAVDFVSVLRRTRSQSGSSLYEHFNILFVGAKPAVPPFCPHQIEFVYFDGTVWRYLDDDTAV